MKSTLLLTLKYYLGFVAFRVLNTKDKVAAEEDKIQHELIHGTAFWSRSI